MKAKRLLILAWLASVLTPIVRPAALSEFAPLRTRISVPVSIAAEISNHALYVMVMINGRGPFRMFVDTGCSVTVISPELATAVGAITPEFSESAFEGVNSFGDVTDVCPVVLETLTIGGATFEGVQACVSSYLEKVSEIDGQKVDGALGYDLFSDLYLALDFPNRRLLLSGAWPENIPPIRTVLATAEHDGVPFVPIQIQ